MEEKVPQYIHLPTQILWFDSNEFKIITMLYAGALAFGGLMWVLLIVAPFIIRDYKKGKSRGYFTHAQYNAGFKKIDGYPLPTANRFYE